MRPNKRQKRGRVRSNRLVQVRLLQILIVGGIGYLIGGSNSPALLGTELSATEAVALRFPQTWNEAAPASRPQIAAAAAVRPLGSATDTQLALFSPEPMVPVNLPQTALPPSDTQAAMPSAPQAPAVAPTPAQTAAIEIADASPASDASEPLQLLAPRVVPAAAAQRTSEPKPAAAMVRRHVVNRPGYMLNDAQIASIKARLNLTPDQERMWPAVETALRNMAYTHAQEARARTVAGTTAQAAAVDPDAVQGLKSAAVPLIMSFNSVQKDEVRSIVHVMGLDQLASEF
jgi:hypothetical protein